MKSIVLAACGGLLAVFPAAAAEDDAAIRPESVIRLFDGKDFDGLYTWLKDSQYEDPHHVFSVEDGLLHVSGDGLGYVATRERYRDYHLVVEYRWGPRSWGNRVQRARDTGVIVHCVEPDGSYGSGTFMAGIEAQIIDGGTGDFIVVPGKRADGTPIECSLTAETAKDRDGENVWHRGGPRQTFAKGRINWFGRDPDWADVRCFRGKRDLQSPDDQWTRLEVLCMGDQVLQYVNGVLVNAGSESVPASGKILLQCELAEVYFRRFELWPIDGPAPSHGPARDVTLTVDCQAAEGPLRRSERFISDSLLRPPKPEIVQKLLAEIGPCEIYRSWIYNQQPDAQAFHWVVQHFSKERKTLVRDDLSWTPYGCALKMQKLHRGDKIRSDVAVADARGVFSVASRDEKSVAVQLWNYQHAGSDSYRVSLRVENLPPSLTGQSVRVRLHRIDSGHSNVFRDPQQRDLQCVEDRVERCAKAIEIPLDLEPNALAMVELMPAP